MTIWIDVRRNNLPDFLYVLVFIQAGDPDNDFIAQACKHDSGIIYVERMGSYENNRFEKEELKDCTITHWTLLLNKPNLNNIY